MPWKGWRSEKLCRFRPHISSLLSPGYESCSASEATKMKKLSCESNEKSQNDFFRWSSKVLLLLLQAHGRLKIVSQYMHVKLASPQAAQPRLFFFLGKSVVLHLHEGPELRMHFWEDREGEKPSNRQDLKPQPLCYAACTLPLCCNSWPPSRLELFCKVLGTSLFQLNMLRKFYFHRLTVHQLRKENAMQRH